MTILRPRSITDPAFLEYGQPITPVGDLTPYGDQDAKLVFDGGPIRFYVMQLENPGVSVSAMTRHAHCSQCLASADAQPWWLVVARSALASETIDSKTISLFRIEPRQALKLHPAIWHAGPYFIDKTAAFYNLELSNTKVADHLTHHLDVELALQLD